MPNNTQADNVVTPRSPEEVEHIVVLERLHRYNYGLPCGAAALRRHLRDAARLHPLPSVRRISHILTVYGLTHARTGWYEGEEMDRLPASAHVPEAQRRHLSLTDSYGR
jgi:hypothetical protein